MKNYFKIILIEIRHQSLVLIVDERGEREGKGKLLSFLKWLLPAYCITLSPHRAFETFTSKAVIYYT